MNPTRLRRVVTTLGVSVLACGVANGFAAENMPPLRIDPGLLENTPSAAAPVEPRPAVPARPATSSVMPSATASVEPGKNEPRAGADKSAIATPRAATTVPAKPAGRKSSKRATTTPFAKKDKKAEPTSLTADKIDGLNDVEVVAAGSARLVRGDDTLSGDRIVYRQIDDEVEVTGNVEIKSLDTEVSGTHLRLRMEEGVGVFEAPTYSIRHQPALTDEPALTILGLPAMTESGRVLASTGKKLERPPVTGSGVAERLDFKGEDLYHMVNATYSTCSPGQRDWEIYVDELDLDYTSEEGSARNALVRFKDTPLFYLPWLDFPLNNHRKSGFLPSTIGSTSKSGLEVTAPWYWNIAPNMDATITPRVMSRRGLQLSSEFRYLLDTSYNREHALPGTPMPDKGQIRLEYLPDDQLAGRDRYGYSIVHTQTFAPGLTGSLNLNGVSDDDYFSDLSTRVSQVSQGNLLRQGVLSYAGPWYAASLNVQSYQTLQNLAKPYQRLPQLTFNAFRYDLPNGLAFNLNTEYVSFDHSTYLTGSRATLYPQLSLPLQTSSFFLTPKLGFHSTHYALDHLDRPGQDNPAASNWSGVASSQSRGLPITSVDGGFILERNIDWFGKGLIQTLEPRAYYLYVPRRDQSRIPIFDSGLASFNQALMFSENRYAGGDRIGDANDLTLAVSSRLLDPVSGADLLRATVGTRYYLADQRVTLPDETARTGRSADVLATLTGQVLPHTYADIGWQYNPRDNRTERLTFGGRYRPEPGKVFNASYRYARDLLGQVDFSAQWPLFGGWHGVGRYNYSTKENRVVEIIGGLEYDAGCWVGRVVVQRLATIADQPTSAFFVQLELNDFSRIGSNPLQLLRRSVPGYGIINQPTADPVFAAE